MRFGLFLSPFHSARANTTRALHRDLDLIEHLDYLGFDEVVFGEHHSGGMELIPAPDLFIAAAARRTERIILGSGVVSLAYHNPFLTAERYATLDHLTNGRLLMGVGPGALPQDALMMGIHPNDQRRRMEECLDVIMKLLRTDEPVTMKTDWFELNEAILQFKPMTEFEIATVCVVSPSGPALAGKHNLSMISTAATTEGGFAALANHMSIAEEAAQRFGQPKPSRDNWRLVGPMHIAETREQAEKDVGYGMDEMVAQWLRITEVWAAALNKPSRYQEGKTSIQMVQESGAGIIGTPDDAVQQILRLQEQTGGFGTYMLMGHEWANPEATKRSYELFAEYVIPEVNRQSKRKIDSQNGFFEFLDEGRELGANAVRQAIANYDSKKSF